MFEKDPKMNTKPLPNYATGSGSINTLEFEGLRSLKVL
jgi:hypothetical protein